MRNCPALSHVFTLWYWPTTFTSGLSIFITVAGTFDRYMCAWIRLIPRFSTNRFRRQSPIGSHRLRKRIT